MLADRYLREMGRHYYVTPTSYLELINTFKKLLSTQGSEIAEEKSRYDNGLSKLAETAEKVCSHLDEKKCIRLSS